jgi:chromosome segregation ATPase
LEEEVEEVVGESDRPEPMPLTFIEEVDSSLVTPQMVSRALSSGVQTATVIDTGEELSSKNLTVVINGEEERKKIEEARAEIRKEFEEKEVKIKQDAKGTIEKYEKKFESLRKQYSDFNKQYDRLKDSLKIKMEENLALQMEKEQVELKIQEKQLEHTESLEEILLSKAKEDEKDIEIDKLKQKLQRRSDEAMRLQIETEEVKHQYEQARDEHKHLERQIRRLRLKNVKLLKKLGHKVSERPISDGDLSEASSMEPRVERQFNALRKNLKKMREYNLYIRGRERYYLKMIDNRREHIEALETALKEASRILVTREQEHMTTIGDLKHDVSRFTAILKEMGVPESILGIGKNKIVVPLTSKK